MIDFIKICLPSSYKDAILNNPILNFSYDKVDLKTGELITTNKRGLKIVPYQTAYYKDLRFRCYDTGLVLIDGSLHKFWNNGEHNFNDFDIINIAKVFYEILDKFKIDPKDARINVLEFGVNFMPSYPIDDILQNLFFHKKKPFKYTHTQTEGNYYQSEHDLYRLKIYDKSLQYQRYFKGVKTNLLRCEINYRGVELRRRFDISTISDLVNTPFSLFIIDLQKQIGNILFYDFTIKHPSNRLSNYCNRNYWHNLIINKQHSNYSKHIKILKEYTANNSENILKKLVNQIENKCMILSKGGTLIHSIHKVRINVPPPQNKTCLLTGFGISMQRVESKLLSHSGLKFYKDNNYKVYKSLEQRFLPSKWGFASDKKKIKEIAHNIRNNYYNRKRRKNPNQLMLFC